MHIHGVIPFHFWMPERRKCGVCHFLHKIGCHGNVPLDIGKIGPDRLSARKALSYGEKVAKIGPVTPEIMNEIRQTTTWTRNAMFSTETTGRIFTKILHDIVALVALLYHAYIWRHHISFLNGRATKMESLPVFAQNCLQWQRPLRYWKKVSHLSSALKSLLYGVKVVKIECGLCLAYDTKLVAMAMSLK